MRTVHIVLLLLAMSIQTARADTAQAPTRVTGEVTDVLGRPVATARVYLLSPSGERFEGKTDNDGRYVIDVTSAGTYSVVFAIGKAKTFRSVIVEQGTTASLDIQIEIDIQGGEVIKIDDKKRPLPAHVPKALRDKNRSLPYSDEAIARDAWARAWLLLDIDPTGSVARLKLLKRPGFGLDKIAIEEAFKLRFTPARDGNGKPVSTYIIWSMEWPAWGWLARGQGNPLYKPNEHDELSKHAENFRDAGLATANWARPLPSMFPKALSTVRCAGSGPLNLDLQNRAYRDCSKPDLRVAERLPWITRATAAMAIRELARADTRRAELVEVKHRRSRAPEIVSLSITGGFAIATVLSVIQYQKYAERVSNQSWQLSSNPEVYQRNLDGRERWKNLSLAMSGALVVSAGVSLFLWNRNQPTSSFSVQPTGDGGASASFMKAF